MKNFAIGIFLLALGGFATSQTDALNLQNSDIEARRAAIATERQRLEAGFLNEDAACYKKFAVNSCLEGVDARRASVMAELRRQEISLNDEQREIKAAQQIRKTQENSSRQSALDGEQRTKALEDFQGRQQRDQANTQRRSAAIANEGAAREANATRLQAHQKKGQARAEKQDNAAEKARKFKERQSEAQERRVRHEADQAKRVKPAAKSLPLPQQ